MSKTTLDKLHAIEKAKVIYNIHYCNAGVGFNFFYGGNKEIKDDKWKDYLTTDKYYPTFEAAVSGEYDRLSIPEGKTEL